MATTARAALSRDSHADLLAPLAELPGEVDNLMADKMDMGWMLGVVLKFVADYQESESGERKVIGLAAAPRGSRRYTKSGLDNRYGRFVHRGGRF